MLMLTIHTALLLSDLTVFEGLLHFSENHEIASEASSIVACCQDVFTTAHVFTDPSHTLALLPCPYSSPSLPVHDGIACGSCRLVLPVAMYQRINGQNGKSELNRAPAQERM